MANLPGAAGSRRCLRRGDAGLPTDTRRAEIEPADHRGECGEISRMRLPRLHSGENAETGWRRGSAAVPRAHANPSWMRTLTPLLVVPPLATHRLASRARC